MPPGAPGINDGYGSKPTDPYYPNDGYVDGVIHSFERPCSKEKKAYLRYLGNMLGFGLLPECAAITINSNGDIIAKQTSLSGGAIMFRIETDGDVYASHFCAPSEDFFGKSFGCKPILNVKLPSPLDSKKVKKAYEMLMMSKKEREEQEAAVSNAIEIVVEGFSFVFSTLFNPRRHRMCQ